MTVKQQYNLANYVFISEISGDCLEEVIDIKMSDNTKFTIDEVIKIIHQLLVAINHLEKNGCIIKFLDPKRIFITEENIKIRNYIVDLLFSPDILKLIR